MTGPYQGTFSAMGAGRQDITVFPLNYIVVVPKVNIDHAETRSVSGPTYIWNHSVITANKPCRVALSRRSSCMR